MRDVAPHTNEPPCGRIGFNRASCRDGRPSREVSTLLRFRLQKYMPSRFEKRCFQGKLRTWLGVLLSPPLEDERLSAEEVAAAWPESNVLL